MHLVPIRYVEEAESALLALRIAWRQNELHALNHQLLPLERDFAAFERKVAEKTAETVANRNRLRDTCAEIEALTLRLQARVSADPEAQMDPLFDDEEFARIGDLFDVHLPEELRVTAQFEPTRDDPNARFHPLERPRHRRYVDEREIRALYRSLARAFHPDLARTEGERTYRLEMMLRINAAWEIRDIGALHAIENGARAWEAFTPVAAQVLWQREELERLSLACSAARSRLLALRTSKTRPLWHDTALTTAAISRHLQRLRTEIVALETRRIRATDEFQQALGAYVATRAAF